MNTPLIPKSHLASLACAFFLAGANAQPPVAPSPDSLQSATPLPSEAALQPLFPRDGVIADGDGWLVRHWQDVSQPPKRLVNWEVKDGVLHGTGGLAGKEWIGTWLLSAREYGNFIIDYEFHVGDAGGNSGLAIRAPLHGDPAFDGMELQMADARYMLGYFPDAQPSQLTGGIERAIAPKQLVYRPEEWNHMRVELRGPLLRAWLNGTLIHDTNLDHENMAVQRYSGNLPVLPVSRRPRRGHIGFQDLGENGARLKVRNARFAALD